MANLIDAWPGLPEAVRKGILAMVEAACPEADRDAEAEGRKRAD